MPKLENQLILDRCPHCSINKPNLTTLQPFQTQDYMGTHLRDWRTYKCASCGGVVLAGKETAQSEISEMYPKANTINESIPQRARTYLQEAINSKHTPSGAIMLSASAIDAMLKAKDYSTGKLYTRIKKAAKDNLLTKEMELWANQIRLEANKQRHADEGFDMPTIKDADQTIEFTLALAEFLFVLPSRVSRGIVDSEPQEQ